MITLFIKSQERLQQGEHLGVVRLKREKFIYMVVLVKYEGLTGSWWILTLAL